MWATKASSSLVSLWSSGFDFLLQLSFLRGFSCCLHLLLLVCLLLSWSLKKLNLCSSHSTEPDPDRRPKRRNPVFPCYKQALVCSLSVSVLSLVLCVFDYFRGFGGVWSEEELVPVLDFAVRSLAWGFLCIYLRMLEGPRARALPFLLRVWWCFFFCVSCFGVVADILLYRRVVLMSVQAYVYDVSSALFGLFFCYVGFVAKAEDRGALRPEEEPLLSNEIQDLREPKGCETVTPYAKSGVFGVITFSWLSPLIALGNKKALDLEDVPQLDPQDCVVTGYPYFRRNILLENSSGGGGVTTLGLAKALVLSTWRDIFWTGLFALVHVLASYIGPYIIDTFVQYLNGSIEFDGEGYVLISVFLVAKLFDGLSQRQRVFRMQLFGIRMRSLLVATIYDKGLTLSSQSRQAHTSGEVINFIAVDAERVSTFCWYLHEPWLVLLQVMLAMFILYKYLGLAAISSLVATVLVMLLNVPLGKWLEKSEDNLMESKDKRMKATSEILQNMRILKLQGWEMKFLSKIKDLRNFEEGWLKKYVTTRALMSFVFWGAPTFIAVATFSSCMVMDIPLSSGKILSALAMFKILEEPIYNLPDVISMIVQTKVSLDRISAFLRLDDLQNDTVERFATGTSNTVIEITKGNFSWNSSAAEPMLKDISFKVEMGMKVAVCGMVGSGKSSLLSCILGELSKISGTFRLSGTKAYVAQSPWIQSGKIEDNILFGLPMDREKYDRILEACSLRKDLAILPFGDQTVIGERGINLSGGQKQRVQIARALYQDADIYLFDDPFSAVDAHTGSHLYKECLLGFLSSKTVIYVTHQVEFLPTADLILVMKGGRVTEMGKYMEILREGADFKELVDAHRMALSGLESERSNDDSASGDEDMDNDGKTKARKSGGNAEAEGGKGQLVQEEEREKGKVGFPVYWKYITTAYGGALIPFILLAQVLFQLLEIASNYWMAWASPVSEGMKPAVPDSTLILVYIVMASGSALCVLIEALLLATTGYKTATILFNKMHHAIFRAPMSFFDSTPSGRILNRASMDQSTVDTSIQDCISASAFSLIQLFGAVVVASQVAWEVFVCFLPVVAVSIWYQRYYIPSARELTRLGGVTEAPVIQHFSETISGSTTIRSFDQEERFRNTNMELLDVYARPKFHSFAAMEWLSFRLDVLSLLTFAMTLIFLISIPKGLIDPAIAGLAVTYGLNLNWLQTWVIWNICNMENAIISVERMQQYTAIESEPPLVIEDNRPPRSWPSCGEISFRDLQVRYAPQLPLVLRDISCTFLGGTKTGIVGRTGSGKSTLIQTLFRIVDPCEGRITIDGIDIHTIGLHDLRSKLSIIPQEPTMFEGTIRSNIDPLEEYSDGQIWEALDKCQLGDEVRKKEGKLDSPVTENGENWSMGQRQLVCLGRVLLKKSKVLVLDEATASVDMATDNLIQQTIRKHFSECTVITIAHRITSVLDSDMVLLLDNGLVSEYDSPKRLLDDRSSSFTQLVEEYTMRSEF
ncbi:hypothetical protein MLD38_000915 [Melastoma candidum]|uniref:Uncharacterized protein n=1 Tax=Melastoma candidum TaxID=119954 RepID=A0ACB9SDJ9_9MYRT|nr:hypothetical protein MLD38_000915 [Melastoma candidum]